MRQQIRDLIKDWDERRQSFYQALEGEDDLGVVVRAHISIENELQHFVRVAAPAPEYVDFKEMDYSATLTLALILGLKKELRQPLRALGSLRNKFSHRLHMTIGRSDAFDIYSKLGAAAQKDIKSSLSQTAPKFPGRPQKVEQMTPRQLLAFSCFYLHLCVLGAAVSIAADEARSAADGPQRAQ